MESFRTYLDKRGYRLSTVRGYENGLKLFLAWASSMHIAHEQISYKDMLAFIQHCTNGGNKKSSVNGKLQGIKQFFNYQIETGQRKDNPALELRIRNVIRRMPHDLLSVEELENTYQAYPAVGIVGKRNKAMLGLMICQGVRTADLAAIEVKDLKLEEGTIYIPSVGRNNSRTLKLEPHQVLQLQKYVLHVRPVIVALTDKESDQLFMSTGKGHRLSNSFTKMMLVIRKLNRNIKDNDQIRASIITHWLSKYNIRQVQYMAGHCYVSSTEHYRTDKLEGLQSQIEEKHPLK